MDTRHRDGFTFIDLLVAIAVMAILVTLFLPMLTGAYETARRFKCASNIRQIGLGMQMYADDYESALPPSVFARGPAGADYHDTVIVRIEEDMSRSIVSRRWDGIGYLTRFQYLDTPEVYYCPSHHGDHPYDKYSGRWINQPGNIVINYQYRITETHYLTDLDPGLSLLADGMRTKSDYNHIYGNNTLKVDLSMPWYDDSSRELFNSLPDDLMTGVLDGNAGHRVADAWKILDTRSGRSVEDE